MSEINEDINTIKNIIENFDKLITSLEKNEKKKNKLSQKTKTKVKENLVKEFNISESKLDEFEKFLKKFGYVSPLQLLPYAKSLNSKKCKLTNAQLNLLFRSVVINARKRELNEFELFKVLNKTDYAINYKNNIILSIKYYINKFKKYATTKCQKIKTQILSQQYKKVY